MTKLQSESGSLSPTPHVVPFVIFMAVASGIRARADSSETFVKCDRYSGPCANSYGPGSDS